jgi:hypothetical protein
VAPCPCRINKPPTYCHGCDATTVVRIERGFLGQVRLDGIAFALVGRSFSEDPERNWNYGYVSDQATPEQFRALQGMFAQNLQALGLKARHLAGRSLGMRQAPLTTRISADGRTHAATIPGVLELETRSIILPGRRKPVVSSGIFDDYSDQFVHADTLAHTYRDPASGYEWDLTGRQANQAEFVLNPERLAAGGLGWGCWSAHADLGARDRYQEQLIGHGGEDAHPAIGGQKRDADRGGKAAPGSAGKTPPCCQVKHGKQALR